MQSRTKRIDQARDKGEPNIAQASLQSVVAFTDRFERLMFRSITSSWTNASAQSERSQEQAAAPPSVIARDCRT